MRDSFMQTDSMRAKIERIKNKKYYYTERSKANQNFLEIKLKCSTRTASLPFLPVWNT